MSERRLGGGHGKSCVGAGVALALATLALLSLPPAGASGEVPGELWTRCEGDLEDVSCGIARGVGADRNEGNVYVFDQNNSRVVQYSAWGQFMRGWGWGVKDGADELQVCVNPGACLSGVNGNGAGQFGSGNGGVAVDNAGDVYIVDKGNLRVQKFDPEGNFVLMFGGEVNKTKVEEGTASEEEENLCPFDPGDVCQEGSVGVGNGQFASLPVGAYVVATNKVYVGNKGRVQVFDPEGHYLEDFPDSEEIIAKGETVGALAPAPGNGLYVAFSSKADVIRLSAAGEKVCTVNEANPAAQVKKPTALASDLSGKLYVVDNVRFFASLVRPFSALCADREEPFANEGLGSSTGIAVGGACLSSGLDVYVSNTSPSFLRAYGAAPDKLELCPRPPKPPLIASQYALSVASFSAKLRAEINPRFWPDVDYMVQYATAECIAAGGWEADCVGERPAPPAPLGEQEVDEALRTAPVLLTGLDSNAEYRFRFVAKSGGGQATSAEGAFRTFIEPPVPTTDGCPNALFRAGPATLLPDCRAYELVSPVDKEGSDINSGFDNIENPVARNQSSLSGDMLTYSAEKRFGDNVSQPQVPQYLANRSPEGWLTHGISPPRGVFRREGIAGADNEYKAFSADLCTAWLVADNTTEPPLAPGGLEFIENLYRRSNCGGNAGSFDTLGAGEARELDLQGASSDGEEAILASEEHLAQDAAAPVGARMRCASPEESEETLFQWLRNGEPIAGKTAATYSTTAADEGTVVQCRETAINPNAGATQVSNPAWIIEPYPNVEPPRAPMEIRAPTASGPLTVGTVGGQTLSCDPHEVEWAGAAGFAFRWYRNGIEIPGETSAGYEVTAEDLEAPAAFQCEAIATNASGTQVAKTSASAMTSPTPYPQTPPTGVRPQDATGGAGLPLPMTYFASHGELRSICVDVGGRTLTKGCTAGTAASGNPYEVSLLGALTARGERVYWTSARTGPGPLYLRENPGQPQSALAGEECTEATKACTKTVSATNAQFWAASPDGSKALYRTGGLTSLGDLYVYDAASEEASLIAGKVSGLLGASEDLARIYLASEDAGLDVELVEAIEEGNVKEGESVPVAGEPNLYLYEGGGFRFMATLAEADARVRARASNPSSLSIVPVARMARVTPDGGVAAFASTAPLTGYDNTDAESGEADLEVYRYEAGADALACVSCNPSGARPSGRDIDASPSAYWAAALLPPAQHPLYYPRVLSEDGDRLFFESFERLTLADTNERKDVYQWQAPGKGGCSTGSPSYDSEKDGCIDPISSGESAKDASFYDATPSGDDVFFATAASLLPNDPPGLIDVYDARVGGGFPLPSPAAPCEGEACQSPPPPPEAPASGGGSGEGNVPRGPCASRARRARRLAGTARRLRRAARRSSAKARARRLRRRARAHAKRARRQGKAARRCRAQRKRRAGR